MEKAILDLAEILRAAVAEQASDVVLKDGRAPMFRIKGDLTEWEASPSLSAEELEDMASALMRDDGQRMEEDYKIFVKRIQQIVYAHNKIPIGWAEIGAVELDPRTIAQHWQGAVYKGAKEQGIKFVISPANKTYLDMKYDESTQLGLNWAGYIGVKDSYNWEPGSYMKGLVEDDILGIECPLWTETVLTMKDIEFMAFPRLPGIAELAWSPKGANWEEYKVRLAKHGKYMEAMNINFFKSPDVDWE